MPTATATRWTVSVSKDTGISVRSFPARRGMKKGDLSKFIEDAVKWRVLDQTVAEARGKFADLPPEDVIHMASLCVQDDDKGLDRLKLQFPKRAWRAVSGGFFDAMRGLRDDFLTTYS